MDTNYTKYLKYKQKYLALFNQHNLFNIKGGSIKNIIIHVTHNNRLQCFLQNL